MKKFNSLFALLLILTAVFCLTVCPQPAETEPEPTPTPETPAPLTSATIDYSKYTAPANADSLTWTTIDASFDFTRLANTTWISVYSQSGPNGAGTMYAATVSTINADVTDASMTELAAWIITGNFTPDEIAAFDAAFEIMLSTMPADMRANSTVEKVTDDPTKLIFGTTTNDGNFSDDPTNGSFRDAMLYGAEIDSDNKYMRYPDESGYEYNFKM